MQEKILILDFGSQYTELIAKRIRKLKVYSEVKSFDHDIKEIKKDLENGALKGVILSGGPNSIYDEEALMCHPDILELNIPILGICYGMQLLANHHGSEVSRSDKREYGRADLAISQNSFDDQESIFYKLSKASPSVWMSHCDYVNEISAKSNFAISASTSNTAVAAIEDTEKKSMVYSFTRSNSH